MTIYVPPQAKLSPYIDYYNKIVAPGLSGYFDSAFWSSLVLQLSQTEDAVYHAVAAICATHQAKEPVALQESNAAIRSLSSGIKSGTLTSIVPLVACVLFSCREFMNGSVDSALLHVFSGLKILGQSSRHGVINDLITPVYSRLNVLCILFGHQLPLAASNNDGGVGLFRTMDEARRRLTELMDRCLRFIRIACTKTALGQIIFDDWIIQAKLLGELDAWLVNLDEITTSRSPSDYLLRMQHRTVCIWLSVSLCIEECAVDAYIDGFKDIVRLGSSYLATTSSNDAFSYEMRIIPPLYYTALKCRDPSVRREALSLLSSSSPREGLWDSRIAVKVAERAIQIEEREMGTGLLPAESSRIVAVKELPAEFRLVTSDRSPGMVEAVFTIRPWGVDSEYSVLQEQIML
jgi:Fungal specific transcription factor domain